MANIKVQAGLLLLFLVLHGGSASATLIDTASDWNGTSSIGAFRPAAGRAFGQSFVVGADSVLQSFSLFLDGNDAPFWAYVMEWHGDRVGGPVLFRSGQRIAAAGFHEYKFSVGHLALTFGATYLAFVDAGSAASDAYFNAGILSGQNDYAGGQYFLSSYQATIFDQLGTISWDRDGIGDNGDAAFRAKFISVPEPATVSLLLAGLLPIVTSRRHLSRGREDSPRTRCVTERQSRN